MKKKVLKFLIVFSIMFPGWSKPRNVKVSPSKNQVVVVGRISVNYVDDGLDFHARNWGVEDFSIPDHYMIYDDSSKKGALGKSRQFYPDEFFVSVRRLSGENHLAVESGIKWCFFGSEKFQIWLPFRFKAYIPDDAKYVYVGDLEYEVAGTDFHTENIKVRDNYDEAKEALVEMLGKEVELCRVEIE